MVEVAPGEVPVDAGVGVGVLDAVTKAGSLAGGFLAEVVGSRTSPDWVFMEVVDEARFTWRVLGP